MDRRYVILDVFTDRPLAGNPLAVVLDSEGLTDARMQSIAAEFNLSETVFVRPPAEPRHTAAVRIFTPAQELRFAGHPTIGTAVLLARERMGNGPGERDAVIVLEEKVGPVRCGVILRGDAGYALMDAPKLPVETGPAPAVEAIAAALGLDEQAIGFGHHMPTAYSAGTPFLFVPVVSLAAIGKVRPAAGFDGILPRDAAGAIYCYTRETVEVGRQFHARMFAPGMGIGEDPATGSAAAAFAGVVDRFDALGEGSHTLVIEQGFEMGRPSLIGLEIDRGPQKVTSVRVGGDAVVIAEGMLRV